MGAAGRPRDPVGLHDVQRAASSAFADRQALRPRRPTRASSAETTPTRRSRRSMASSTDEVQLQPVHRIGFDRDVYRRVQRRQFRSRAAWFRRRRLCRPGADSCRPIESTRCRRERRHGAPTGRRPSKDNYLSTVKPGTGVHGSFYAYRDIYLDLDPTYKDRFGRPLMRMTMDFKENEIKHEQLSHRQVRRDHQGDGR